MSHGHRICIMSKTSSRQRWIVYQVCGKAFEWRRPIAMWRQKSTAPADSSVDILLKDIRNDKGWVRLECEIVVLLVDLWQKYIFQWMAWVPLATNQSNCLQCKSNRQPQYTGYLVGFVESLWRSPRNRIRWADLRGCIARPYETMAAVATDEFHPIKIHNKGRHWNCDVPAAMRHWNRTKYSPHLRVRQMNVY